METDLSPYHISSCLSFVPAIWLSADRSFLRPCLSEPPRGPDFPGLLSQSWALSWIILSGHWCSQLNRNPQYWTHPSSSLFPVSASAYSLWSTTPYLPEFSKCGGIPIAQSAPAFPLASGPELGGKTKALPVSREPWI